MGIFNYLKPIDCNTYLFIEMILRGGTLKQSEQ